MPTTLSDPRVLAAKYKQALNSYDERALGSLIAPDARFSAPWIVQEFTFEGTTHKVRDA